MAGKKTESLERAYIVPLRREFLKAPKYKRAKKALAALRQFIQKHMKSEDVVISTELNNFIWRHGMKNPPHHIKIAVSKDKDGRVAAGLEGKKAEKKAEEAKDKKTEDKEDKSVRVNGAKKANDAKEAKEEKNPAEAEKQNKEEKK
jgi:large subunit ribosomal protein L31e